MHVDTVARDGAPETATTTTGGVSLRLFPLSVVKALRVCLKGRRRREEGFAECIGNNRECSSALLERESVVVRFLNGTPVVAKGALL